MENGNIRKEVYNYEENSKLIPLAKAGNQEAMNKVIEMNLPLVSSISKKFLNRGYDYEDIFQIGSIGLVKAINNFDDKFIRLECKYKHNNMTSKDQILIDKELCSKIINGKIDEIDLTKDNLLRQFALDYRLNRLNPSIIVDYNRVAFTYHVSDVRITFDSQIKSGMYNYNLFDKNATTYSVIDDNQMVLEVKFNEILPESIALILQTVPTFRQAFSKFATCRNIK